MASLRARLERMSRQTIAFSGDLPATDARKVLALLAAAKRALYFVEENNEDVVQMVGAFGLHADLLAALAAFEEGPK